jgi:serine/threonine protein kinase
MLNEKDYVGTVDNWSLGVLAYELVVGKTPFFCSTSGWSIEDDQAFKKTLHDAIFGKVKGWRDEDAEEELFGDRAIRERSGKKDATANSLFDTEYRNVVTGLMKREGSERMHVQEVFERLSVSVEARK